MYERGTPKSQSQRPHKPEVQTSISCNIWLGIDPNGCILGRYLSAIVRDHSRWDSASPPLRRQEHLTKHQNGNHFSARDFLPYNLSVHAHHKRTAPISMMLAPRLFPSHCRAARTRGLQLRLLMPRRFTSISLLCNGPTLSFICPLAKIGLPLIAHKSRRRKYTAARSVSGPEAKAWMSLCTYC